MFPSRCLPLLLVIVGGACVDLNRPPLERQPGNVDGGQEGDSRSDGPGVDGAAPPDTAPPDVRAFDVGPVDAPDPADAAVEVMPPPRDAALLPVDLAAGMPDAARDLAVDPPPPAPDLAPDAAPDVAPDVAPDLAPDLGPDVGPDLSPDLGPPALVIDDFQTATAPMRNNLGSPWTVDNQVCNKVAGEMVCTYDGTGGFHDFIETLNNWCGYSASSYKKFRFRMRTSVPGELVTVYAGTNTSNGCSLQLTNLGMITTSTTMTTYEFDISTLTATRWLVTFELAPNSTNTTQFIFDDLELAP